MDAVTQWYKLGDNRNVFSHPSILSGLTSTCWKGWILASLLFHSRLDSVFSNDLFWICQCLNLFL